MWKVELKRIWFKIKRWLDVRLGYISAAPRLIFYLNDILKYGAYTVDTEFEYVLEDEKMTEKFIIRTMIELDGDVTNFIPNPVRYKEENWLCCFEDALKTHAKNLEFFFRKLEESATFWAFMTTLPIIIALNYRLLEDLWTFITTGEFSDLLQDQILDIGIFIATAILLPPLIRLLIPRLLAFIIKRIEKHFFGDEKAKS